MIEQIENELTAYALKLKEASILLTTVVAQRHGYKTRAKEFRKLITQIRKNAPKIKHITTGV
ncbi:hypothetical protein [Hydrogenimonas sp.]